jgi:hypothetical protein
MKIYELIQQPEGSRREFKQELPAVADLCKPISMNSKPGKAIYAILFSIMSCSKGCPNGKL